MFRNVSRGIKNKRKGAGAAELAALEMPCTPKGYRGFESHPFRQDGRMKDKV